MSSMAKMSERLDAMEKKIASLQTLSGLTKTLLAAEPQEVEEWLKVCQELMEKNGLSPLSSMSKGKGKGKDKVKRITNSAGPSAWNVLVQETWKEMAEAGGVDMDSFMEDVDADDEKAVKNAKIAAGKAAAAAGASYQDALQEAKRRKNDMEGRPQVPKKVKVKVKEEQEDKEDKEKLLGEACEMGMEVKTVNGIKYLVDEEKNGKSEAYRVKDNSLGERVGMYYWKTGIIDEAE